MTTVITTTKLVQHYVYLSHDGLNFLVKYIPAFDDTFFEGSAWEISLFEEDSVWGIDGYELPESEQQIIIDAARAKLCELGIINESVTA